MARKNRNARERLYGIAIGARHKRPMTADVIQKKWERHRIPDGEALAKIDRLAAL